MEEIEKIYRSTLYLKNKIYKQQKQVENNIRDKPLLTPHGVKIKKKQNKTSKKRIIREIEKYEKETDYFFNDETKIAVLKIFGKLGKLYEGIGEININYIIESNKYIKNFRRELEENLEI
jgi:hypothetical protein